MKITREQAAAFLVEYEALTKKHDIFIGACGCCDSPWLARHDHDIGEVPSYGWSSDQLRDQHKRDIEGYEARIERERIAKENEPCWRIGPDGCPACTAADAARRSGLDLDPVRTLRACRDCNRSSDPTK